jgi:hypothetical protein
MKRLFLSILMIVFLPVSNLFCQSEVKEEMENVSYSENDNIPQLVSLKASIPCNFFNKLTNAYVGISDILTDSATSYQQAYVRALSIAALKNGMARGMSDFFNDSNGEKISSNYEELCELKAHLNIPANSIKIVDSLRLKTGEFVLFLTIDSTSTKTNNRFIFNSLATIYYKENETNFNRIFLNKIVVENKLYKTENDVEQIEKLDYNISNNRWLNKEIIFNNKKIRTDSFKTFYETEEGCVTDTTDCKRKGTNTVDGLWYAYSTNFYKQLSGELKDRFLNVKSVGDKYASKDIKLNRESGFFRFDCQPFDGVLFENKFLTRLKINCK